MSTAELQSSTLDNYQLLEDSILFHWRSVDASRVANQVHIVLPDGAIRADNVSAPGSNGSWIRARGIQYAEHPVGALRWQPPVPRAPWEGEVDATQFGDNCINAPTLTRLNQIGDAAMSEACLSLNVWASPLAAGDAPHIRSWYGFTAAPLWRAARRTMAATGSSRTGATWSSWCATTASVPLAGSEGRT